VRQQVMRLLFCPKSDPYAHVRSIFPPITITLEDVNEALQDAPVGTRIDLPGMRSHIGWCRFEDGWKAKTKGNKYGGESDPRVPIDFYLEQMGQVLFPTHLFIDWARAADRDFYMSCVSAYKTVNAQTDLKLGEYEFVALVAAPLGSTIVSYRNERYVKGFFGWHLEGAGEEIATPYPLAHFDVDNRGESGLDRSSLVVAFDQVEYTLRAYCARVGIPYQPELVQSLRGLSFALDVK
jgi:hypothetical protein